MFCAVGRRIRPLRLLAFALAALLAACGLTRPSVNSSSEADIRARIDASLPTHLADRSGWIDDIYHAITSVGVEPTRENICAVSAVIAQESGYQVDPVIPQLGRIAWSEIDARARHADIPLGIVHTVLKLKSANGASYAERIDAARTEHQLSTIFEDFTGSIPLGRRLFASWNPIRTRGPMQVNVAFVHRYADARAYPFAIQTTLDDELFTRRGSLYYGVAHLLDYRAPYDSYLYRFADYNAGQYASRNAAFQLALSHVSGQSVVPDGSLLTPDAKIETPSHTEQVARTLGARLQLSDSDIHQALQQGERASFADTALYRGVFQLAVRAGGYDAPPALVPQIELQGPKITRPLTTDWYAHRVDGRFQQCLAHAR